ncbi:MAG: hypothetical protein KFF73_07305 [Cyclobacteriaceae bacterium]|nr:hypothetical protein [Cyclobacteriaceae bacterium]
MFFLIPANADAQCDFNKQSQRCIKDLHDGFIYIKSFEVDGLNGGKEKIEYSYVMTRDTQYYLNICTPESNPDGIIVTIYDSQRNAVSSNFADGKFYEALIFQCSATGIYYLTFTFNDSKNFCGSSVLAFKK